MKKISSNLYDNGDEWRKRPIVKDVVSAIEQSESFDDVVSQLLTMGFKKLGQRGDIYRAPKHDMIVKSPILLHKVSPKIKPYLAPTLSVTDGEENEWYLQPITDRGRAKEGYEYFLKIFGPEYYKFVDLNIGNVGVYKNNFVLFDW